MALPPQGVTGESSSDAATAEAVLQSAIGKAALRGVFRLLRLRVSLAAVAAIMVAATAVSPSLKLVVSNE